MLSNDLNSSSITDYIIVDDEDSVLDMILRTQSCESDSTILNRDGTVRKVNRLNYDRSLKRTKIQDPWNVSWLQEINHI